MKQIIHNGQTVTEEAVLQAMERFDKEQRATFPNKRWVTYAVKHNDKLYPPKQLMRLTIDPEAVGHGGTILNSRYEALGFTVVTLDKNEPTTTNNVIEEDDEGDTFSLEEDMENSLAANLEQLERGLRLYPANGSTGQQLKAGTAGRIDLLTVDEQGDFVVIELKAAEADRQVCGQIQAYMGWVKENLAGDKKVRGIIVASNFTERCVYAAKVVPDLRLKKYQINFKFTNAE